MISSPSYLHSNTSSRLKHCHIPFSITTVTGWYPQLSLAPQSSAWTTGKMWRCSWGMKWSFCAMQAYNFILDEWWQMHECISPDLRGSAALYFGLSWLHTHPHTWHTHTHTHGTHTHTPRTPENSTQRTTCSQSVTSCAFSRCTPFNMAVFLHYSQLLSSGTLFPQLGDPPHFSELF